MNEINVIEDNYLALSPREAQRLAFLASSSIESYYIILDSFAPQIRAYEAKQWMYENGWQNEDYM